MGFDVHSYRMEGVMFVIELLNWDKFGHNLFHFAGPYATYAEAEEHCHVLNSHAHNGARWTIRRKHA